VTPLFKLENATMKHGLFTLILIAGLGLAFPAPAADVTVGTVTVSHPWARASAGMAKNGAAYLTIANHGTEADRLTKAATPAAHMAELHSSLMEGEIMTMRPVEALEITPGKPTMLAPGGLHIMLMGLVKPLKEGETFPMTLTFETAGPVDITVMVKKLGAMGAMDHKMGHGM